MICAFEVREISSALSVTTMLVIQSEGRRYFSYFGGVQHLAHL